MTAVLTRPAPAATRSGGLLAVLLTAVFMALVDATIVNVAMPTIGTDLHASGAGLQLVVAGYLISYAVLLITGARLGDRLGHGRVFRAGLIGFTTCSLLCGLAPGITTLVVCRLAQGAGAALMMPQVMSLIQRGFAGAERAKALSLYSAVIASGSVVGQICGGLLVSADVFGLGWRPVFLVNVPIGLALLVLGRRHLPAEAGAPDRRLDPAGVVVLSLAVGALVLPLVLGHEEHWPLWGWLSLVASGALFAAFVLVERGVGRRHGQPLVSAQVLRAPGLVLGMLALLVAMIDYSGYLFTLALHLQSGLGDSPARAGLIFAPAAVGFAVTSLLWGLPGVRDGVAPRLRAPMIPVGLAVAVLAYLGLAPALHGGRSGGLPLEADLLLLGLALGLAFSPIIGVALTHVPLALAADASGVLSTVFQLGQVLGVALLGTVYLSSAHAGGAASSAHALTVTLVVLAASAVISAALALSLVRPRRPRVADSSLG
jgi:EmrB/QacA subfamily drug resistance transporter